MSFEDATLKTPEASACTVMVTKASEPRSYNHFRYFESPTMSAFTWLTQAADQTRIFKQDPKITAESVNEIRQKATDWSEQRTVRIGGEDFSMQRFSMPSGKCVAAALYQQPAGGNYLVRFFGQFCAQQALPFERVDELLAGLRIDKARALTPPPGKLLSTQTATQQTTNQQAAGRPPANATPGRSSGSGFLLNPDGEILTNHHVINGCSKLSAAYGGQTVPASVIARRAQDDLAVIKAPGLSEAKPIRFRDGKDIRPGDGIIAVGFPYAGLLTKTPQVSTGTVTALAGLRDDTRYLQINSPIQPGNSGGPLLDSSGHVSGIVASMLNVLAVAKVTGSVPQNVNFAIKQGVARDFLIGSGVKFQTAASAKALDPADVGEIGARSTVYIECTR